MSEVGQIAEICFVASARDYHAIDWYRVVKSVCPSRRVVLMTDLIESEGVGRIVHSGDDIELAVKVDKLLLQQPGAAANVWRNIVKLLFSPLFAAKIYKRSKARHVIFHAHSMYYIFICWLARVKYIATPMGSDVLVRPNNSVIYRYFTKCALRAAFKVTVDSEALMDKVNELCDRESLLVQNGIDTNGTAVYRSSQVQRKRIVSMRGFAPNYQIHRIFKARNDEGLTVGFDFIYPFHESEYYNEAKFMLNEQDRDLGRVAKTEMYGYFHSALLVLSVPVSDSSPRSVYEAIFCGAIVAVTYGRWIDYLPECMKQRVIIVAVNSQGWLSDALEKARSMSTRLYVPSEEAIRVFDEYLSIGAVSQQIYH